MAVRITSMVLRVAVLLTLILGLLVWFDIAKSSLTNIHMGSWAVSSSQLKAA